MLWRKKRKLIDSLMGFYHITSTIYTNSKEKYEEDDVRGLMMDAHLDLLFTLHKKIADTHKIPLPETKKIFTKYVDSWNKTVFNANDFLTNLISELTYKKSRSYII